ncbi:hypothetical protein E2C01_046932 [Portunus trituberculatus]|uniref:Uncharacterized protein n=1 Tax=Portunus trituberculatus TaxID=210409 RepID=A0A5B7G7G6_PORTR|nr:hypothetical protein [Portunus trituberculatus]
MNGSATLKRSICFLSRPLIYVSENSSVSSLPATQTFSRGTTDFDSLAGSSVTPLRRGRQGTNYWIRSYFTAQRAVKCVYVKPGCYVSVASAGDGDSEQQAARERQGHQWELARGHPQPPACRPSPGYRVARLGEIN